MSDDDPPWKHAPTIGEAPQLPPPPPPPPPRDRDAAAALPPPPPPRNASAYFVPIPVAPAKEKGPPITSGLGTLAITLGVLVVLAGGAVIALPSILGRGDRTKAASDEPTRKKVDPDHPKETHAKGKVAAHLPILETDPVRGGSDALVTIVEFSDFQCPFCGRVETTLTALQAKYGDKLRLVWKDLPLSFHKDARPAAELARVAELAGGNDAFWTLHDTIYKDQTSLSSKLATWGSAVGADAAALAKFKAQADDLVDDSETLAKDVGVSGTPNFFIDGERLTGAQPQSKFEAIIDAHLGEAEDMVAKGVAREDVYSALVDKHWTETPTTPSSPSTLYDVDVAGAPSWGPPDALVTVVVFGDLAKRPGSIDLASVVSTPDVRVVWRDAPHDAVSRVAAEVLRAIDKKSGSADRLAAIREMWGSVFTMSMASIEGLAGRYGLTPAEISAAEAAAPTDAAIDDDLDRADEVSASTTATSIYVNGTSLLSPSASSLSKRIADERAKAEKLVKAGTAPADVYDKIVSKGTKLPRKHAVVPIPASAPSRGPASAAITIQVFSDFQCPFCKRAMTGDFESVVTKHASDVRVVYREMPLSFHAQAEPAAEMALEARAEHGVAGFWRVHDALYAVSAPLDATAIETIATKEGLDLTKVRDAITTHKYKAEIDADTKAAGAVGLTGTPSFIVETEIVVGAQPASAFEAAIKRERSRKGLPPI